MTRAALLLVVVASAAACRSSENEAEVGTIAFEIPPSWHRTDTHGRGIETAVFDPADNARKELSCAPRS